MYGVYLVDDERAIIDGVIHTLSWLDNGFEVVGFNTNPLLAMEEIKDLKPDLVICDLKMPEMDGIALIKELRDGGVSCEFIILSAFAEFEASRSLLKLGGFDYMMKPLDEAEAEAVLEKLSRKLATKNNLSPSTARVSTQAHAFDELVEHISENYDKKHTLASLGKQFNISASYICGLFAKHYNSTLTIFLTDIRMQEAARMLRETDAPLKEIAILCSYANYFHFCRLFKTHFGLSPTEYRQTGAAK
jgi:YesN/AraC family two-component response regulator